MRSSPWMMLPVMCVALTCCGDTGDGGSGGAPFGGGNPSAAPGGSGNGGNGGNGQSGGGDGSDTRPQGRGAPYEVPNYGATVFGADLEDPERWAVVRAWFLKSCPGGTECIRLERRYRVEPDSVAGCKFLDTTPGSGGRLGYGQTLVVWGTMPCPDPDRPSPDGSPPVGPSPVDSPPVESPAQGENAAAQASGP
jgi:hypothetical protein